jgi:hypothetical protein
VNERSLPAAGVRCLVKRVDHEAGDEFVAAVGRCVAVRPVITVLHDEALLRQTLEHRHDGGVGQVSSRRQCFVHLADRLRFARRPQVVHHFAFEFPESRLFGHVSFTLLSNGFRVLRAYYRVSYPVTRCNVAAPPNLPSDD